MMEGWADRRGGWSHWHRRLLHIGSLRPRNCDQKYPKGRRKRHGTDPRMHPLGVDMLYVPANKYPWLEMQTIYPFSEEGIGKAVADAMAMKTKSTIVPWPELVE